MSTTIDNRVVEMRFENKNFESNAQQSISTLEKLKQKLNLTGASKGLADLDSAARKVNMSGLGSAVDAVSVKFSAMQIAGITALTRITNQAIDTGQKMLSALTVDPIKTGFQEYETQMNAVQTILANTQSKGSTLDDVNNALDALNTYADKTIYNFTEMTRNIGTFTAAGVDLQTSVDSIQGIANLAAVSGSTSQQASTAMYQLSQALAAGKVSLMDWNSVVNAGMGGELFQNALLRTSELLKTGGKEAVKTYGSFRESLTKGEWLTKEVLTETLKQLSGAYTEADLIAQGFTEEQAKEITSLASTASDAATKVKTFTQLWDVMKESAQSGWSQTWKLIIGDFEQAKLLLTPLADFFTGVIGKMSDARNKLLEGALGKTLAKAEISFSRIRSVLDKAKEGVDSILKPVKNVSEALGNLNDIADKVISGSFGNGQDRFKALTEAGENYYRVQNKVNETLGNSFRYSEEQIAAQDKLLGKAGETAKKTEENAEAAEKQSEATDKLTKAEAKRLAKLTELSDEQLKSEGYTKAQIDTIRELEKQANQLGFTTEEFLLNLDQLNGRWILWNSFKNIGQGIVKIFQAMGQAYRDVFPAMTSDQLYNIIAGFHKFTTYLKVSDETADNFRRTLRGVFSIISIVTDILGGGLRIAFKLVSAILEHFDTNILEVTANIGDAIYNFRKATDISKLFGKALDFIVPLIGEVAKKIKEFFNAFTNLPGVKKFVEQIRNIGKTIAGTFLELDFTDPDAILRALDTIITKIVNAFKNLGSSLKRSIIQAGGFKEIGNNIIEGLKNGILGRAWEVIEAIVQVAQALISGFCEKMGIQSPSTVAFEWGQNIVQGIINGIAHAVRWLLDAIISLGKNIVKFFTGMDLSNASTGFEGVIDKFKVAFDKFKEMLSKFDYKKLLSIIPVGVALLVIKKIYDIASAFADGINNINDVIEGFSDVQAAFTKVLKSYSLSIKADALKKIATAIAILVGSIIALTYVDTEKLYDAVGTLVILSLVLAGLMFAMDKFSSASIKLGKKGEGLNIDGLKTGMLSIGATLLLLAGAVKIMGSMERKELEQGFTGLAGAVVAIGLVFAAFGALGKYGSTDNIEKAGGMVLKVSIAMLLMVGVAKLASKLTDDEMKQAAKFAAGFLVFVGVLVSVTKMYKDQHIDKVGGLAIKISVAMILLIGVTKLASKLSNTELKKGAKFAAGFLVFVGVLVTITKIGEGQSIAKLGGLLLSISISLLLMVGVCKLVGKLTPGEMIKGGIFALAFIGFIALLVKVTKISSEQKIAKVAGIILVTSIAIGLLAGVSIILSMVSLDGLLKGVGAVTVLGLMMAAMIWATRGANSVVGNLIVMTSAIVILAAAIVILSAIDFPKLAAATGSMAILMGLFAVIIKMAGSASGSIPVLITMTAAVGLIGGVLYVLAKLPVEQTIGASIALSALLLAISGSMAIISKFGTLSKKGLVSLGVMTLVVGALAGILWLIQDLPVESTMNNVKAISLMLLSMSGILAILTVVGLGGPAALIGIGSLAALIVGIGGLIIGIGALVTEFPKLEEFLNTGIPILEKIGSAIGAFFGNIVGGFIEGVSSSFPALGLSLSQFMINATPFIVGVKMVDASVLEGVGILSAAILALTVTDLINGIASLLSGGSSFADLGYQLSAFAISALPFFTTIKMVDPTSLEAVGTLASAIITLTAANFLDGISKFLGFGGSLSNFGEQLVPFGEAMADFSTAVSGKIDESAVTAAANAGNIMAEMQKNLYGTGGIIQWFCGEKDMGAFGEQLVAFGGAICDFSNTIVNNGGIDESAVTAAANAGNIMAEMQKNLYGTGGIIQWFCGEKDFAAFGEQLVAFGESIVEFSNTVSAEGAISEDAINAAANAGSIMASLQSQITPIGGVVSFFAGEQDLETFGTQIVAFGESIVAFSKEVSGNVDEDAVTAAANAGKLMAEVQAAIPEDGWFDGKVSIDDFGKQLAKFGEKLVEYSDEVVDVDTVAVGASISAANRLATLAKGLIDLDPSGIDNFNIKKIGTAISDYYGKISEVDNSAIGSSITVAHRLVNLINSLVGLDTSGVGAFKTAIKDLSSTDLSSITETFSNAAGKFASIGTSLVDALTNGMTSKTSSMVNVATKLIISFTTGITAGQNRVVAPINNMLTRALTAIRSKYSEFKKQGENLVIQIISGITTRMPSVSTAFNTALTGTASSISANYQSFYNAGVNLVDGFVKGINQNSYKASAQARAMALAAKQAAEEALGVESPSKVFYGIGNYVVRGFVNALADNSSKVFTSGYDMADQARIGLSKSIAKINGIISGSIETQPTIRPVLDLSEISAGAGTISQMFNGSPSVGLLAETNTIAHMMNRRQNGGNNDVVSAIGDLKKAMSNLSNNTYQINGITYDDGSNISNAIETLVRAANIERRA